MSREGYVPPSTTAFGIGGVGAGASGSGLGGADSGPVTQYQCGECASKVQLKKGDPIRCRECGHRVLYKERTKRYVGGVVELMRLLLVWQFADDLQDGSV